jgi:hypothetical protein
VKAAIAGIAAGLLAAAIWFALLPAARVALPAPTVRSGAALATASPASIDPAPLPGVPTPQAPVAVARAAPPPEPPTLPGFIAGPPPRMATADAAASERNRQFLEAVNSRARGSR